HWLDRLSLHAALPIYWTEVMMREAGGAFGGIGVHYYTIPGDWSRKGAATGFDEEAWARTLSKTLKMEELLTRHSAIMDKYDPNRSEEHTSNSSHVEIS